MAVDSSGCCTGCRTGSILPAGIDHRYDFRQCHPVHPDCGNRWFSASFGYFQHFPNPVPAAGHLSAGCADLHAGSDGHFGSWGDSAVPRTQTKGSRNLCWGAGHFDIDRFVFAASSERSAAITALN